MGTASRYISSDGPSSGSTASRNQIMSWRCWRVISSRLAPAFDTLVAPTSGLLEFSICAPFSGPSKKASSRGSNRREACRRFVMLRRRDSERSYRSAWRANTDLSLRPMHGLAWPAPDESDSLYPTHGWRGHGGANGATQDQQCRRVCPRRAQFGPLEI